MNGYEKKIVEGKVENARAEGFQEGSKFSRDGCLQWGIIIGAAAATLVYLLVVISFMVWNAWAGYPF